MKILKIGIQALLAFVIMSVVFAMAAYFIYALGFTITEFL